jgi:hypothetical protein
VGLERLDAEPTRREAGVALLDGLGQVGLVGDGDGVRVVGVFVVVDPADDAPAADGDVLGLEMEVVLDELARVEGVAAPDLDGFRALGQRRPGHQGGNQRGCNGDDDRAERPLG